MTLYAERTDRMIAYRLREAMLRWLDEQPEFDEDEERPDVVVCSDVWWLNNDAMRPLPTVCVGSPETNALTAYLADKLPSVFAIEGALAVLADLDFTFLRACCWGRGPSATASAVDAFCERYLDAFMRASLTRLGV